jgi:tetratricopeptide (TPR) repeat protein
MRRRIAIALGVMGIAVAAAAGARFAQAVPEAVAIAPAERAVSATMTTRDGLTATIATLTSRVAANRSDERAAVGLADALMRQARVVGDASLPKRAEDVLSSTIAATDSYLGRRMLGAVYLAQHRFLEALDAGNNARALRPDDPWNYGVIGDAAIELGRYDAAFAAFDRMASIKPSGAA